MIFDLYPVGDNQPKTGILRFTARGAPDVTGRDASTIFSFLVELNRVWLPRCKACVEADLTNPDHQEAAAAALGVVGYRAEQKDHSA